MIAQKTLLIEPALDAGIKIPDDLNQYSHREFAHWRVFEIFQLGRPMPDSNAHWSNAKIIAAIPNEWMINITAEQLEKLGAK